ncbi:MAG: hypothetical protein RL654_130 [Pseudomonadota bacterium]|jgi:hypothetical protein
MSRHSYVTKVLIKRATLRHAMCEYIASCTGSKAMASAITTLPPFAASNHNGKPNGTAHQINLAIDAGLIWANSATTGEVIRRVRNDEALKTTLLMLTPMARLELEAMRKQAKDAARKAQTAETTAVAAMTPSRTITPRMAPLIPPQLDPMARPPAMRPGSMDFAGCPSRIGAELIAYKTHC